MEHNRDNLRLPAVLIVVALMALAGCGGKSHKVDPAADLALAKRAVLTAADLPGYTAKPHTPDDDIPAAAKKEFASCMGTTTSIFDDTPGAQNADSPDFDGASATGLSVSNSIEIDPKKSDIDKGWDQISKPSVETCLGKLFDAAFKQGSLNEPGVTVGAFKVERYDVGIGDRSVGYEAVVPVSGQGRTAVVYLDLVFVARDRAGMDFSFTDVGKSFDRTLEKTLAQKVYDRVGNDAK
jgi:hypothetical protein